MATFETYVELLKTLYGNKKERKKEQIEKLVREVHHEIEETIVTPSSWWFFRMSPKRIQVRQQDLVTFNEKGFWIHYLEKLSQRLKDQISSEDIRRIAQTHLRQMIVKLKKELRQVQRVSKRFANTYPSTRGVQQSVRQTSRMHKTLKAMPEISSSSMSVQQLGRRLERLKKK